MTEQFTRRDFAIRMAAFGLVMGPANAVTLAQTKRALPSETLPAIADPYSFVDPELLPALKQFPAFDVSAEFVRQFRQMPGVPALPAPAPLAKLFSREAGSVAAECGAVRKFPGRFVEFRSDSSTYIVKVAFERSYRKPEHQ